MEKKKTEFTTELNENPTLPGTWLRSLESEECVANLLKSVEKLEKYDKDNVCISKDLGLEILKYLKEAKIQENINCLSNLIDSIEKAAAVFDKFTAIVGKFSLKLHSLLKKVRNVAPEYFTLKYLI